MTEDGHRLAGPLKPICPELQLDQDGTQMKVTLADHDYRVILQDSANSDGGDLNDVFLVDDNGKQVAARFNVPAFGDPVLALAGGHGDFREEVTTSGN